MYKNLQDLDGKTFLKSTRNKTCRMAHNLAKTFNILLIPMNSLWKVCRVPCDVLQWLRGPLWANFDQISDQMFDHIFGHNLIRLLMRCSKSRSDQTYTNLSKLMQIYVTKTCTNLFIKMIKTYILFRAISYYFLLYLNILYHVLQWLSRPLHVKWSNVRRNLHSSFWFSGNQPSRWVWYRGTPCTWWLIP